jgi:Fe-S cluster assembly protein SufD
MPVMTDNQSAYLSDFEALSLGGPVGKRSWLEPFRREAMDRFLALGFPTTRDEEWRYTSVAPLAGASYRPVPAGAPARIPADLSAWTLGEEECCQLVFVNGRVSERLSSFRALPKGVRFMNLAEALESERELLEPHLARHASFGKHAFTALNTAFFSEGAFIRVPPRTAVKSLIHVLFISTSGPERWVTHPRTVLLAGAGSEVTLVESYAGQEGAGFTNAVTEIVAAAGSVVNHYRLQRESDEQSHVSNVTIHQERDSSVATHSISLGGGLVRNEVCTILDGEGANCILNGLYVTRGRQHVDNHTTIDHAKPHCTSRELYKGILDDRSTGVFNGRVIVRPDAQKTSAVQTNRNLLLSEEALVNTKPQLEIYADDVKCTHGATIGQLEDDTLFYLRSRGIGEDAARTMLTHAFASELIRAIQITPVQCQLDLALLNRLTREDGNGGVQ